MTVTASEGTQYVLFRVGPETYAVEIGRTQEVVRYRQPKKIPHARPHVLGVFNLRGQIIPLVGLRERFGQVPQEPTEETRVIVCEHEGRIAGLVCDAVEKVVYIPAKQLEENPEIAGKNATSAIRGVARLDAEESVIFLIDLAHVLSEPLRNEIEP